MRTHRATARQFPGSGCITERLGGQGTDRTKVDDVARQFGIHRLFKKRHDLRMLTTECLTEFQLAGDLFSKAHTAGAVDAAGHVGADQRTKILVDHDALFFLIARTRTTVAHRDVLQLTFAALIADRTVKRVIDEQELHHPLLRIDGLGRAGEHPHAGGHRRRTGRQRLVGLFHLHETHAAVGRNRQFLVIAEVRDVDVGPVGRVHHGGAIGHRHRLSVDLDLNHAAVLT